MKQLLIILFVTLCSAFCWAQGNDINESMLRLSRQQFQRENYDSALYYINKATLSKGKVLQDPELAAAIHEQYCLIFSALNNKQQSDYHRNMYLDIKEQARRDIRLEEEAEHLQHQVETQGMKIAVTFVVIIAMLIVTFYFVYRFNRRDDTDERILSKQDYSDMAEGLTEDIAMLRHTIATNKEQNADKQTKVFLINSITPLMERMRHEMDKYLEDRRIERIEYIDEILSQIAETNYLLTEWIRLEQGKLSFRVETFPLEELFHILRRNKNTFAMKGIVLEVESFQEKSPKVKADKTLTLFMLNTLTDNARKATPEGGQVTVSATEEEGYVEISITDTGKGMNEEELANVFTHSIKNGHGFGLQNCRGIINSYKKAGNLFSCCMIGAESQQGKGSRFYFRLAKALSLTALLFSLNSTASTAETPSRYTETIQDPHLRQAASYADSAYYCNMDGRYKEALHYADSVQLYLTDHIMSNHEVDSLLLNDILVDISNEAAVASLALHRWEDYHTYNNTYEQCFNKLTNNSQLEEYCREKETELNYLLWIKWLCNVFAVIAFITAVLTITNKYLRRKQLLRYAESLNIAEMKNLKAQLAYENDQLHISNNILTNGLSTIKHETLYFPSRISTLLNGITEETSLANIQDARELTAYYRELHIQLSSILIQPNLTSGLRIEQLNLKQLCGADINIYADKTLLNYMLRLLKKKLGVKQLNIRAENPQPDSPYTDLILNASSALLPPNPSAAFSPKIENIPYMVCRQIVRQMSGQNESRGCGITVDTEQKNIRIRLLSQK